MAEASWLFIKGTQSIWVERPYGRCLIVSGPGELRDQRDFVNDQALDQYEMALAERLASDGWFLWGVNRDRREHGDRRRVSRGTFDRRVAHPARVKEQAARAPTRT